MTKLMTVAEVARLFRVTAKTVRDWHRGGVLVGTRVSPRCLRFSAEDVEAMIQRRTPTPIPQGGQTA